MLLRRGSLMLLGILCSACARVPAAPALAAPPTASRAHCGVLDGRVSCGATQHAPRDVDLPFPVRVLAARHGGGAYALGADGQLARIDARGRLSGSFASPLLSLTATWDYVCGVDRGGRVLCARDYHHDLTCPNAGLAPFVPVTQLGSGTGRPALVATHDGRRLCATAVGATRCVTGLSPCERHCLAYPACARPRCIDPCPAPDAGAVMR